VSHIQMLKVVDADVPNLSPDAGPPAACPSPFFLPLFPVK